MNESTDVGVTDAASPHGVRQASEFLQTVVDALPDALMVIDREYNIILANKAARVQTGIADARPRHCKCYRYFHHRETPCVDQSCEFLAQVDSCPVAKVFDTKSPMRDYHTHYDPDGKAISVAVDAAPILDDAGEVVLVVETCRDVTERSLSRRLLRIGNQHMEMQPLLDEYAKELRQYTGCENVGFHILDNACAVHPGQQDAPEHSDSPNSDVSVSRLGLQLLCRDLAQKLPESTRRGSLRFDRFSDFMATISEVSREQMDASGLLGCESVALIPIRYDDADLGILYIADRQPQVLNAGMVESLERLSLELATAIQRVRVEEALRVAHEELENRVHTRTAELTETNQALQNEISERGRLEREILQVSVREQQRIGQELHDELGQELTGLSYLAQGLLLELKSQGSPHVETATEVARSIPRVLGQIQNIVRGLVPLEIGAEDLEIALDVLTSNVAKLTGTSCEFASNGCESIRDDDTAIQVYRIAQEAITNAVKHAQARNIVVTLQADGDEIRLDVCDDGVGIPADAAAGIGCGLRCMRYRARAIGGRCDVVERRSGGTTVTCVIPQIPPNRPEREKAEHDV